MSTRRVTYTMMVMTDGTRSVYEVIRATLHRTHRPESEQYINLQRDVETVARIEWNKDRGEFDRFAASQWHETTDAPAFEWAIYRQERKQAPGRRCPCGRMTANDCAGECGVLENPEQVLQRFNTLISGNLSGWVAGRW